MARTNDEGNVAASNVPSMVEAVSSNDMIAESASSESVENKEATMTIFLDESDELNKKVEETKDGPDEAEEVDENEETKTGPYVSEEEETEDHLVESAAKKMEESVDDFYKSEEIDGMEESEDHRDNKEDEDRKEETRITIFECEEGAQDAKKNERVVPTGTDVLECEKVEEGVVKGTDVPEVEMVEKGAAMETDVPGGEKVEEGAMVEEVKDPGKEENTPKKKAKRVKKKKKKVASNGADKSSGPVKQGTSAVMGTDVPEVEMVVKGAAMETDVPGGEKVEEGAMVTEVKDLGIEEDTSKKKAKMVRKKKKKAAPNGADKSSGPDKQGTSAVMGTDVPEGEKVEKGAVMETDVPRGEEVEEGAMIKEIKYLGKDENTPKKKAKRVRKKKKKVASNGADKLSGPDKQGTSSAVKKDMKMADGMGLIFMCNAKTKMDCFRYKVFGLPESKKEMVAKIYKGMRLFLFDIDLKLLYGIYKAASPGGYNIEPKAFKSGFPSQVRFHVVNDYLPLPEEKFKVAIKGNYYGRNKFNCQLSPEQVKDLCKLFQSEGKTIKKRPREVARAETEQISSSQGRKRARRKRDDDSIPRGRDSHPRGEVYPSRPQFAPRSRDVVRAETKQNSSSRSQKRAIRERARRGNHVPRGQDPYARREVYSSPPPRALVLPPPPLPQASYAYSRSVDDSYYRREPPLLDPRDHRGVVLETRRVEPLGYRDPYSLYREPLSREVAFREPLSGEARYGESLSREAGYPLSREFGYREPLSREAGYAEPVLYQEALYPISTTSAAVPSTLYYRY